MKKIRVGFDLDGVIVDSPFLVSKGMIEKLVKTNSGVEYRFPKSKAEQLIR